MPCLLTPESPEPTLTPWGVADFEASPVSVARAMLGAALVRTLPDGERLIGRVVETEAYGARDPAFIGWRAFDRDAQEVLPRGRARFFFGAPGQAVLVKTHNHWMLNVTVAPEGEVGGVLIRALEPLVGKRHMAARRAKARRERDLARGPGRLTAALALDDSLHLHPLQTPPLLLAHWGSEEGVEPAEVVATTRVGLRHGHELPWRFYLAGHPCVSRR